MQIKNSVSIIQSKTEPTRCCSEIEGLFNPDLFKALSDPNRVSILARLAIANRELTVSEVAAVFQLNFSVVSRHLKLLKGAKVLAARKEGKEVLYSVNSKLLAAALRKMADAIESCCVESTCCQGKVANKEGCHNE